jgi:branched-chain amino acid transport system ATP-binding protein
MIDEIALDVKDLDVYYKDFHALWGVSLEVKKKEIVSVIGSNGAGKSTLLNTIAGLLAPKNGTIHLAGEPIQGLLPHETVPRGLALVPEGRRMFPRLTVYENLMMGAYADRTRAKRNELLEKVHDLFPKLSDRRDQMADTLSGGEQQMLAIGRAMMSEPSCLLCDEISLGLAPVVIKDIYRRLEKINKEGMTIVLVEQDVTRSLKVADRAYIMLEGKVVLSGSPDTFSEEDVRKAYFGI